jgi:hypothetical protein
MVPYVNMLSRHLILFFLKKKEDKVVSYTSLNAKKKKKKKIKFLLRNFINPCLVYLAWLIASFIKRIIS